jgi:hypothetical protein
MLDDLDSEARLPARVIGEKEAEFRDIEMRKISLPKRYLS